MSAEIDALDQQILDLKKKVAELRRAQPPEPMEDFAFEGPDGPVSLSTLFGDKDDLLIVHNMGTGCSHCTLWADGFNGVAPELASRAGFVLVSPDSLAVATNFATKRGWRFPVVVDEDKGFSTAVGRWNGEMIYPGVSAFHKSADGAIVRVSSSHLGEGDDFCAVWHLFDLLKDGWNGWEPKYRL